MLALVQYIHTLYSVLSYSYSTPIEIPRNNRESTIDGRDVVPHLSDSKERANLHVRLRIPVQADEQGMGAPITLLASRQHGTESPLSGNHELVQRKSYSSKGTTETRSQVFLVVGLRHAATVCRQSCKRSKTTRALGLRLPNSLCPAETSYVRQRLASFSLTWPTQAAAPTRPRRSVPLGGRSRNGPPRANARGSERAYRVVSTRLPWPQRTAQWAGERAPQTPRRIVKTCC